MDRKYGDDPVGRSNLDKKDKADVSLLIVNPVIRRDETIQTVLESTRRGAAL